MNDSIKFNFEGKVVLVTGSSRGIGKETALMFAHANAKVAIHYVNAEKKAADVLQKLPGNDHSIFKADISDPKEVETLIENCFEKFGRIDILVNNAGVYEEFDIINLSYEKWQQTWDKTIKTNLYSAANLSFLVAKKMKELGGCKIINISSRGAFRGEPDAPAYGASKAGMNSFGQSFARAFAKHNIFVYTIAPGFVDTDMAAFAVQGSRSEELKNQSPLKRVAQPDEIARVVLFLASEGTNYMTGCVIDVNGASYLRT
ncbi:MAG: SDR family oxidoreductase [Bacteroidales bacterium]|nr:SDR family oxidoreductase [Bacteroidales bacterium]MCF8404625.1 SDR family oxidoreductase [Bacteroidales bacterium]